MSPVRSIGAPPPRPAGPHGPPSGALPRAGYWVRRYWVQDLAAAVAMLACATALGNWPAGWLGPVAALTELATFYCVAYLRHLREARGPRRGRGTLLCMAAEYGPAEALDLFLRPVLMTLFAAGLDWTPALGLLAGSLVADVVFYLCAARSHAQVTSPS